MNNDLTNDMTTNKIMASLLLATQNSDTVGSDCPSESDIVAYCEDKMSTSKRQQFRKNIIKYPSSYQLWMAMENHREDWEESTVKVEDPSFMQQIFQWMVTPSHLFTGIGHATAGVMLALILVVIFSPIKGYQPKQASPQIISLSPMGTMNVPITGIRSEIVLQEPQPVISKKISEPVKQSLKKFYASCLNINSSHFESQRNLLQLWLKAWYANKAIIRKNNNKEIDLVVIELISQNKSASKEQLCHTVFEILSSNNIK